jgi:hypothetical protein
MAMMFSTADTISPLSAMITLQKEGGKLRGIATREARARVRYGFHIELVGILLGILPINMEVLIRMFMPLLVIRESDFCCLTVAFILSRFLRWTESEGRVQ